MKEKKTLKIYRNSDYDTINIIGNILMEWIQQHQEMSSTMTQVYNICPSRMASDSLVFYDKCNSLKLLLITFLDVIRFILLIFFYSTNNIIIEGFDMF